MLDLKNSVKVFESPAKTGVAAGKAIEDKIVELQERQQNVRIIFAAAPSQDTMLDYLSRSNKIDWKKIIAFNMDEYLGLPKKAPQLFANYLEENLFSKVGVKEKHLINPWNDVADEIDGFSQLITMHKIDIVCLGIGENGHIAFNDPPVADFGDSQILKKVVLDDDCRLQQVHDACFEAIEEVPTTALTLTIPTLLNGRFLYCVVVGDKKGLAVKNTLRGPISTSCPASILRKHPHCMFYFDKAAYKVTKESMQYINLNT